MARDVGQFALSEHHAANTNLQPKGRNMITQLFKRRFFPEDFHPQIIQHVVLLVAAIIFVAGFCQMAEMELTKPQLALGFAIVFGLVLQCCILWVLIELARKLAAKAD